MEEKQIIITKKIQHQIGYVYFIVNIDLSKIYIGETTNINRIKRYESVYHDKDIKSHKNSISPELLKDLLYRNEDGDKFDFNFYYFETVYYKKLERIYINYLSKNYYDLYNKIYYKVDYCEDDIDKNFLKEIGANQNTIKKLWYEHNEDGFIGNVYLGGGLYGNRDGDIVDDVC